MEGGGGAQYVTVARAEILTSGPAHFAYKHNNPSGKKAWAEPAQSSGLNRLARELETWTGEKEETTFKPLILCWEFCATVQGNLFWFVFWKEASMLLSNFSYKNVLAQAASVSFRL